MAIDDNADYTLTGAQVKDLAARIKTGGGGMTVYVDASFASPSSITEVYSDSALSAPADPEDMADIISAGGTVVVVYDGGQVQERIELSSVNSNSRFPEVGHTFTSTISTSAVFSVPTVVTLLYDDYNGNWSVETTAVSAVNNGTLTIQHNGTTVQTFTANQSTNATANIETIYADPITSSAAITPLVQTNMIADGAVTSAKIDWNTMEHWAITLSGNTTVSQTTSYNYVDVPGGSVTANMTVGGVYLVFINASVRCQGGSTDCYARVVVNGNNQVAVGVSQNPAAGTFTTVSSAQLFTPSQASNTFKLQIGGGRANSDYMIAGGQISSVQIIRIA